MIALVPGALAAVTATVIAEADGVTAVAVGPDGVGIVDGRGWTRVRPGGTTRYGTRLDDLAWDGVDWVGCGSGGLVAWSPAGGASTWSVDGCDAVWPFDDGVVVRDGAAFRTWRGAGWATPAGEADFVAADAGWIAAATADALTLWTDAGAARWRLDDPVAGLAAAPDGPLVRSGGVWWTWAGDTWPVPDDLVRTVVADTDGDGEIEVYAAAGGRLWSLDADATLGDADLVAAGDVDGDGCDELVTAAAGEVRLWNDRACDGPADPDGDGYTPWSGDCDDGDDRVYPGAREACDAIDNDCDGQIDEIGTFAGYLTADALPEGQRVAVVVKWEGCEDRVSTDLVAPPSLYCTRTDDRTSWCTVLDGGAADIVLEHRANGRTWETRLPFEGIEVAPVVTGQERALVAIAGEPAEVILRITDPGYPEVVSVEVDASWARVDVGDGFATVTATPPRAGAFELAVMVHSDGLDVPVTITGEAFLRTLRTGPATNPRGCGAPAGGGAAAILTLAALTRRRRS